jgi:hypothetical protein
VSELFPGLYKSIEQKVAARAKTLVEKKDGRKLNARAARKRETLAGLSDLIA